MLFTLRCWINVVEEANYFDNTCTNLGMWTKIVRNQCWSDVEPMLKGQIILILTQLEICGTRLSFTSCMPNKPTFSACIAKLLCDSEESKNSVYKFKTSFEQFDWFWSKRSFSNLEGNAIRNGLWNFVLYTELENSHIFCITRLTTFRQNITQVITSTNRHWTAVENYVKKIPEFEVDIKVLRFKLKVCHWENISAR